MRIGFGLLTTASAIVIASPRMATPSAWLKPTRPRTNPSTKAVAAIAAPGRRWRMRPTMPPPDSRRAREGRRHLNKKAKEDAHRRIADEEWRDVRPYVEPVPSRAIATTVVAAFLFIWHLKHRSFKTSAIVGQRSAACSYSSCVRPRTYVKSKNECALCAQEEGPG